MRIYVGRLTTNNQSINTLSMKNESLQSMKRLHLSGMANAYEGILTLPIDQLPTGHDMVASLLDAEEQHRVRLKTDTFMRLSKMRYNANLKDVECHESRNLNQDTLLFLAQDTYLQRRQNIIITGATGCGKSFLACAIGQQACLLGYRTLYFNLNRLSEQIALAKTDGSFIKWLNRVKKAHLIIIDDFGLQPITQQVKLALLQIIEDRYDHASTIICSQLPVAKWHEYFAEPTIADAVLDRIVPKAHRIELKGHSRRTNIKQLS